MMAGVHAISIGALGTLTTTMMLRTGAARGAEHIPSARIGVMAALVTIAALLRIFSASTGSPVGILVAAVCWTLALLVALSAILPSGSCCSHSSVKRPAANPR
jgi:uncharacterized protein involved in response to NO